MSDSRSSLEYICVALFLIAAYDVLLFFRGISTGDLESDTWVARGFVNALVVPVLGVAGWRSTIDRVVDIRRPVAFYVSWLLVLGISMTVWLIADFYVIAIGQYWGNVATIVGVAATLLAVCIVLLSGTIRGGTRVFLRKVLFPYKYDYRREWLRFVGTLWTVVRAVAPIVNSPGGIVWIQNEDDDDYLPVDAWHCDLPTGQSISRDSQLVRFLRDRQWIIDFNELEARPKLYDDLALDPWFKSRVDFWLVVPLFLGKQLLGMIVLLKPTVVPSLNFEDHDLLRTVGRHIATHIKQAELDKRLAESRQFGAYNRLTAFLMHDLNNLIAQQSLVVKNAEKHRHDPKFVDDTIDTIANSVARMNRLMEQLTSASKAPQVRRTDLRQALQKAVERSKERGHVPSLDLSPDPIMLEADAERLTSIFEHLIRNAQDATDQNGRIEIKTTVSRSTVQVSIRDNGRGMDSEFIRERLFRPFDSTKGRNSMGIGAYQARDYVRTLGGQMDVSSQVKVGTEFLINLPLAD
jgi:putative PEP-CTERM system histidine kinase